MKNLFSYKYDTLFWNNVMQTENDQEKIQRPLSYFALIVVNVFVNIVFMIVMLMNFKEFGILYNLFIPLPTTFLTCLFSSLSTKRKTLVSPSFVMVGNLIAATLLNGVMATYYYRSPPFLPEYAQESFLMVIIITAFFYLIWTLASFLLNSLIRGLIGAYAETQNIENLVSFYKSPMTPHEMIHEIEKEEWLNDICSLDVVNKTEEDDLLKLRLGKLNTDFYLGLYVKGESKNRSIVSIAPHQISATIVSKTITSSQHIKDVLAYQLQEIETQLKLKTISNDEARILPETVEYVTSPARFPLLVKYRKESAIATGGILTTLGLSITYLTKAIDSMTFVSILTMVVTATIALVDIVHRKS
jgi:hypothetical protein